MFEKAAGLLYYLCISKKARMKMIKIEITHKG
jgi:hypothetical protein